MTLVQEGVVPPDGVWVGATLWGCLLRAATGGCPYTFGCTTHLWSDLGGKNWLVDYAPLVGVLSVARTSLTLAQVVRFTEQSEEVIWGDLGDLQQFIELIAPTGAQKAAEDSYHLYHQSVIDFLRRQFIVVNNKRLRNPYYLPAET